MPGSRGLRAVHVRRPWRISEHVQLVRLLAVVHQPSITSCASSSWSSRARVRAECRPGTRACPPAPRAARTRTAARTPRSCAPPRAARRGSRGPPRAAPPPSRRGRRRRGRPSICLILTALVGARPPGPDGVLHIRDVRVTDLRPRGEALAQPGVRHVAVAVVRVLGEHREDQLVHRGAVGAQHGTAVLPAEPVEDRANLATVGHEPVMV